MIKPITEIVNNKVFNDFLLVKLNANAVAATTNMIQYWMIVTVFPAQKEPSAGGVNDKLHCNILTAYFWNGKIAE